MKYIIDKTTTKQDLEKQKKAFLKELTNSETESKQSEEIEEAFDQALIDLEFLPYEEKYATAIKNHTKMGIHTFIFVCGNGMACVIRQPSPSQSALILPYLQPMEGRPDYLGAGKVLLDECWVAGDSEIRKDDDLTAEVAIPALNQIQLKMAKSKKN